MREITLPVPEEEVRALRVGERFLLTGRLFTARDAAHARIVRDLNLGRPLPFAPVPDAVYHCGPLVERAGDGWRVLSAGPTSSVRLEPFAPRLVRELGLRILIGKGGMGEGTRAALREHGAIYAHATGGAGALATRGIERVESVFWLEELGMPEAVWILRVCLFGPLLVAIDSHGGSLYEEAARSTDATRQAILSRIEEER